MNYRMFLIATCAIALSGLYPETSNAETASESTSEVASYMEYIPRASDFHSSLEREAKLLQSGIKDNNNGHIKDAIKGLTSKLSSASRGRKNELLFLLGLAQENLGDCKAALKSYDKALKVRQRDEKIRFRQAICLRTLNRCDVALKQLKELLWLSKSHEHEIYYLMGECYSQQGEDEKALTFLEKSRQKNSFFAPTLKSIVREKEKLIALSQKIQEKSQLEVDVMGALGTLIEVQPNNAEAIVQFGQLLLRHTDSFLQKQQLADLEGKVARIVENSNYKNDSAVKLLFDIQIKNRALEKADQVLSKGLKQNPKSATLLAASKQLSIEKSLAAKAEEEEESNLN